MFYSSIPVEDIAVLTAAFDKKYGVKVKVWRAELRRDPAAHRATRPRPGATRSTSWRRRVRRSSRCTARSCCSAVKSPYLADLIPESIAPHGEWASVYLNTFVQAFNTDLVKKDDLPKTYSDLLKPEFKGKLGIEAEDYDWFAQVVMGLARQQGLKLFRDIVATNGISVRKGHTLLSQPGRGRRGAAGAHRLWLHRGADQEERRAARLVHHSAADRAADRRRRGAQCAASARRRAVLRFPDQRRAADPRQPQFRVAEPEDRVTFHQGAAPTHRLGA